MNNLRERFEKETGYSLPPNYVFESVTDRLYIEWLEAEIEYLTTPYFGWCDVEGCEKEACQGGGTWRDTGYWSVCTQHAEDFRQGKPQPKMKQEAIDRENSRDKMTGYLPLTSTGIVNYTEQSSSSTKIKEQP